MKLSRFFLPTLKESPSDADNVSAKLMIRSGMVRKVASGLYEWLPLGLRVLKKVEQIVREEMNRMGALEVWLPHIQPKELWEETGRWAVYGKELLRLKDRKNTEFCFAPTAEEVITDLARRDVRSYRDLPVTFYQFGAKFRDEIRPRFGVMRAREFYMKDAYSFHADDADLDATYRKAFETYGAIFKRCALKFRPVEAHSGAIGGSHSHEFMVLAETGEEEIISCDSCGYAANTEQAECLPPREKNGEKPLPMSEVSTPGATSVEDVAKLLKTPEEKFIKAMFYVADGQPVVALVRGDTELNEAKLTRFLNCKILGKANDEMYQHVSNSPVGYGGPVGLKTRVVADHLVAGLVNGVAGANKKDAHLTNVNIGRDYKPESVGDLRKIRPADPCPRCGDKIGFSRGIEVGHTFKLGTKYSQAMGASYLDEKGQKKPFVMGCYGIGVSRVVAAAIEQNHDEQGIIWPMPLAPFSVIITPVNFDDPKSREAALVLYEHLESKKIPVLLDDRPERAGVKFKDADLIGIPVRVVIGEKGLAKGRLEVKERKSPQATEVPLADAVPYLQKLLS